ncbi:hypothetical protein NA57DRAFT_55582 [Rhizodiscina lignyota]|uniref:OPA3-domain-containing protein n=1 Tax=Rhizodiscina lignyota TaxID=1504668 RepID=A0A9P4IEU2_9PEZI|nr:hypothetical protein NA57DRAFT_55582 [Rhizodiscina lignyota]
MSLTLKFGSLAIRTLSKPIANYIKRNARDHERFRKLCVAFAQSLHRVDMRLRLGLLQDPAAIDRQIAREVAEANAKRKKAAVPTVKTEEQTKADQAAAAKEKDQVSKKIRAEHHPPRIRPLSESKAIETGANFISETFLFLVAGALILFENRRSKRKSDKEHDARDDEIERIGNENATIKAEVEQLKQELVLLNGGKPVPSSKETKAEDATVSKKASEPPPSKLFDREMFSRVFQRSRQNSPATGSDPAPEKG